MVRVKGDMYIPVKVELEMCLLCGGRTRMVHAVAEHLWVSNHECNVFHGFRFVSFTDSDEACLAEYLEQIASSQNGVAQSLTA